MERWQKSISRIHTQPSPYCRRSCYPVFFFRHKRNEKCRQRRPRRQNNILLIFVYSLNFSFFFLLWFFVQTLTAQRRRRRRCRTRKERKKKSLHSVSGYVVEYNACMRTCVRACSWLMYGPNRMHLQNHKMHEKTNRRQRRRRRRQPYMPLYAIVWSKLCERIGRIVCDVSVQN